MNPCRHGHADTPANTGMRAGRPYCKPCNRISAHDRRACLDGHGLTPENTYRTAAGFVKCRTCRDGVAPIQFPHLTEGGGETARNGGEIGPIGGQTVLYVELSPEVLARITVDLVPIRRASGGGTGSA